MKRTFLNLSIQFLYIFILIEIDKNNKIAQREYNEHISNVAFVYLGLLLCLCRQMQFKLSVQTAKIV